MRTTRTLAFLAALAAFSPRLASSQEKPAPVPAAPPAVKGVEVLTLPGEARGDASSSLDDLLAAVKDRPDDPGSVLAGEAIGSYWNLVADGRKKSRAVFEAVAGDSPTSKDSWALERHRGMLQELRLADGDTAAAVALSAQRGYVRSWLAVGPFGYSTHAILDEVFPPETDLRARSVDPKARYLTTKGEASWAKVPARKLACDVFFGRALRSTGGAVYLLAHVESPAEVDAVLEYSGAAAKVFVNRGLAATVDRHRRRLDARVRFEAHLRKGWNRIVVKTGSWSSDFALRIANQDGSPVAGLKAETELAAHDVDAAPDGKGALRDSAVVEALASSKEAVLRALYAHALELCGKSEEAYVVLEDKAVSGELASFAWFHVLRAHAAASADHLLEATRRVETKRALEKALEKDKWHAAARRQLADQLLEDDKPREGLTALEDQLAAEPNDTATRVRLYDALLQLGWEHEAEKALGEVEKLSGTMARLTAKASWIARKGDRLALQKIYEEELAVDRRAHWVLGQRRALAMQRGDEDAAKKVLAEEEAAATDAEEGAFEQSRADLAFAFGHREEGAELLAKALDARPGDLDLRERLARALAELGTEAADKRALALLDDLLVVEPHRWAAQNLRTSLRKKVDQFWKEWEFDAASLLEGSPKASAFPKAQTIMLQDQTVTRIRKDGSSTEVVHQCWKVFTDQGKEKMGRRPIVGDTMNIRVFTPKGEVLEPIRAGGAFEMPGLAPGAVVDQQYLAERGPHHFQYTNGPWFLRDPDLVEPFVHSRWIVISPKSMNLEVLEKNLEAAGCKKTVEERGDDIVRIWETHDQDRIEPEPHMPRHEEFLPWVKLYERRSLEDMAGFYLDQSVGRTQLTPTLQAKADEIVKGLDTDQAKLKAIVAFAKEHVKQDMGGETASQILAAKGGSKTTLVMALLDAAKVPYRYAIAALSPDVDQSTDWAHPEPNQFHTPLLRVEPKDGPPLWVSPDGPRYSPLGLLPTILWGAPVFVCDGASGKLDVLPRGDPGAQGTVTRTALTLLDREGNGVAKHTLEWRPLEFYDAKEQVKNAPKAAIKNFAAQRANQLFTGASLTSWSAPRLDDPDVPFTFNLELKAEELVQEGAEGRMTLATGLVPSQLKRKWGGRSTRRFDLVINGFQDVNRDTVTIDLGPFAAPGLPPDVQENTRFGQYSLVFVREGPKLRIERSLALFPRRVPPSEYKEFLDFLAKVDAAEQRPLIVEPSGGAAKKDDSKKDEKKDEKK